MPFPAAQTYLKTRASIMARRLFSAEQLERMLHASLDDLASAFALREIFENNPSPALLNRAAERALIHTLMLELAVLLRPLAPWLPFDLPASIALVPTEYKLTVPFVILIIVLVYRPTGIFKGRVL